MMNEIPFSCPFCGVHDDRVQVEELSRGAAFVHCLHCQATGPTGRDERDAIERWNVLWPIKQRVPADAEQHAKPALAS